MKLVKKMVYFQLYTGKKKIIKEKESAEPSKKVKVDSGCWVFAVDEDGDKFIGKVASATEEECTINLYNGDVNGKWKELILESGIPWTETVKISDVREMFYLTRSDCLPGNVKLLYKSS